jgi:hypothetical protein
VRQELHEPVVEVSPRLLVELVKANVTVTTRARCTSKGPDGSAKRKLDEDRDRSALRLEDRSLHVAQILAVDLQRQRPVAANFEAVEIVTT